MTKAIIIPFHKYQPYGDKYYDPIYDYFIANLEKIKDEFDKLYLIDSNWEIKNPPDFAEVIRVNPSLRYYDAYKAVLPKIKEDLVLFLDNDFVIYRKGIVKNAFDKLKEYDVVSIFDTCGTYKTDKLNGGNKFCPYFFATKKDLLMKYRDVEWGPQMPEHETLGKLTEKMLEDDIKPFEIEEDKSSIFFDGTQDEPKNLGYYHIRAGATPAVLLAWKEHAPKTYQDYIKNQPKREYLRQMAWYHHMIEQNENYYDRYALIYIREFFEDANTNKDLWSKYMEKFIKFHGL